MFKPLYNPGATGVSGNLNVRIGAQFNRDKDLNNNKTFLFSADMPLTFLELHGVGAGIQGGFTKEGIFSCLDVSASLSYKFKLGDGTLSIGIQPGYNELKYNAAMEDNGLEVLSDSIRLLPKSKKASFNLASGMFFTISSFWTGISLLNILSPKIEIPSSSSNISFKQSIYQKRMTISFMTGYMIKIGNKWDITPSTLILINKDNISGILEAVTTWNKLIIGGIGYQLRTSVNFLLGLQYKGFSLAYNYCLPISHGSNQQRYCHNISFGYSVKIETSNQHKRYRYHSIRYM